MPFGLCIAPATNGLGASKADIIIMGKSFEEHLQDLQQMFERIKLAGLKLHPGKCQFLQQKVARPHCLCGDG